jgi:hypothetical protein
MISPRPRTLGLFAAAAAAIVAVALVARQRPPAGDAASDDAAGHASTGVESPSGGEVEPGEIDRGTASAAAQGGAGDAAGGSVLARLGWGRGAGRIGAPDEEEGEGETPLRLATDAEGNVVLLDGENDRLVRLGPDGSPRSDVALPVKHPKDVAMAKDGTFLLLDSDPDAARGDVVLVGPDGKTRGKLPIPAELAKTARSVVVSGKDVYVESYRGELTRVGDASGAVDKAPKEAPGQPTRDGRGYLSARLVDEEPGAVHVYMVERDSLEQRFSRQVRPRVLVEGIFLIDTNAAGVIYLGVTGSAGGAAPGTYAAQLLCLEPEHGEVVGSVDLPVTVGPEAILDAKALDSGGVVYSVFTREGIRVERRDCM